jgi:hypothetical protein
MKLASIAAAILTASLLSGSVALAFETDQYNLPDRPLADTGEEISEYIFTNLQEAVDELNTEIARSTGCIAIRTKGCGDADDERRKLTKLQSDEAPATALFRRIGDGNLFRTKFGRWLYSHAFHSAPASYKAPYGESVFLINPLDYSTLSPTFRLYGIDLGGDKLEHLLQQGFKYYSIYREQRRKGLSEAEASAKAIAWGQRTERTYFGLLSSGVYSNADLFANYAGLKFYLHLTKTVEGQPATRPLYRLENGRWVFAGQIDRGSLLKPFITDHMNEALNASSFRVTLYGSARRQVQRHACAKWVKAFPAMSRDSADATAASLESWNGEDYGYTKRSRTLTLGETCFAEK